MRNTLPLLLLLALWIPPLQAAFNTSVGVFDTDRFLQHSGRANAITQELEQWSKTKQQAAETLMTEIKSLQNQLADPAIGPEQQAQLTTELQTKTLNLRRFTEDTQAEHSRRSQNMLREIEKVLGPLIQQVAKREGIQLVLNKVRGDRILYFEESIDITDMVVTLYDKGP
ncbi:MAG: OmpH family outer membrane protein [Gammaproteobacteria bacterium]|jgi:Skp family chaperone for outer membrane proteins